MRPLHGLGRVREMSGTTPRTPQVELFTHPICRGCQEATLELTRLAESGAIELVTWSLAVRSGRARALKVGVTTVPTVLVGPTCRNLDTREALAALVDELQTGRLGGS